ncbi:unnamed protein product [Brachionus calyciflorus]|uniref:SWIM-type domain-containing protein n=1 Tax=Brachionus calyciflorus TaxID=104777 RepID=A0A813QKU2_9BILA|nr:unnamed protein product [Brachionus calyciflorus]
MDEDSSSQFSTESEYERELVTQNFLEIETFFKSTQEYKSTQTHVKNLAKKLEDKLFFVSSNEQNLGYYYGLSCISTIDIFNKTCSCRWFIAYSTCAHLYKAFQLFDVQTASSKFVIRARRGPKKNGESKIETNEDLAKDSLMTPSQLSKLNSLCNREIYSIFF